MVSKKDEQKTQAEEQKDWGLTRIFGGALLLLLGILLLLGNIGVIEFTFHTLWQLWPLAIIIGGVSLLPLQGWVRYVVVTGLFIVSAASVLLVTTNNPWNPSQAEEGTQQTVISADSSQVEQLDLQVKYGGGKVMFSSSDDTSLATAQLESDHHQLVRESQVQDNIQKVVFDIESERFFNWGSVGTLDVALTRNLPVNLTLNTGATSVEGDLSQVDLRKLVIDSGASSTNLKLGALASKLVVDIDVGASSVELALPESVGVEVRADAGLTSVDLQGVEKVEDGLHRSANFSQAKSKVIIHLDAGVSSVEVTRY